MNTFDGIPAITNGDFEKELNKLSEKELLILLCTELHNLQNRIAGLTLKVEE